jgi:hypothetical protein
VVVVDVVELVVVVVRGRRALFAVGFDTEAQVPKGQ